MGKPDKFYEDILRQYKTTHIQAANDLERLIFRGELPAPGTIALAILTLRRMSEETQDPEAAPMEQLTLTGGENNGR